MKKKRFLSMLLVLCIIFAALPADLFAAGSMPFTDVKETDLYYDAVKYVHENGMMSGTGMNLFSPDATTTRGMIVTILHRIEGEIPNFIGKFKDVPSGKYYSDAVEWASANGIVGGYGNGKFGPDDTITREQMVTILYRYAQYKGYSTAIGGSISSFSDGNQVSPYAYEAMSWAIGLGSISTIGNNKLAPKSGATRAQVASALMKLHKFSAPTYHTVTFKYNHSNMGVYKTVSVQSGAILKELTDPEISGYSFGGWYTKEIGGVEFNLNSPIYEDIVLYANWFKKESDQSVSSSAVSKQSSVVPSPSVPYYPFPWQPPSWGEGIYTLNGTVYDYETKNPITGAYVELVGSSNHNFSGKHITDDKGNFKITAPKGKYKLRVTKDNYSAYEEEIELPSILYELGILLKKQYEIGGDCTLTGRITIADKDMDLTNNKPLEGVDVVVRSDGGVVKTARTDSDGMYEIKNLLPGVYTVKLSKDGYMTTEQKITIKSGENKHYNLEIETISEEFSGVGKAVGLISDAVTGKGVPGLTLRIRKGIDNTDGEIVATVKTDSAGRYLFEGEAGHYTIEIVDERTDEEDNYIAGVFNIKILGNTEIEQQNATVSRKLTKEQLRVVLTWGKQPLDLDSHMYGPTSKGGLFHIYFRNMRYKDEGVEVDLDLDDTDSYGPETTTIRKALPGKYRFVVHDYTNRKSKTSDALGKSGAIVKVYLDGKEYTFNVPPVGGIIWEVFEYDSNTRTITPINKTGFEGSGIEPMKIEFEKMKLEEKYY